MKRTKEELEKEINDRLFYFYGQTDGTFNFPNSAEGDLLKLVNEYMKKPDLTPTEKYEIYHAKNRY